MFTKLLTPIDKKLLKAAADNSHIIPPLKSNFEKILNTPLESLILNHSHLWILPS